MSIPDLTHLQYLILAHLATTAKSGQELRAILKQHGVQQSGPAFYQLMGRLETAGLVRGQYQPSTAGGHACRERRYKIATAGLDAWEQALNFYMGTLEATARDRPGCGKAVGLPTPPDPMGILR